MRLSYRLLLLAAGLMTLAQPGAAQDTTSAQAGAGRSFTSPGFMDLGLVTGTGGIGESSAAGGVRFEKGLRALGALGGGTLGLQLGADVYFWHFGLGHNWTFVPVGASLNYHIPIQSPRLDPFVGVGAGYSFANCGGPQGVWADCSAYESEPYFIGRVGARYQLGNVTALYADAGAGASTFNLGFMLRLK
jgi:hypothetical protein